MNGKHMVPMENLLKWRSAWIGCAMLWIVLFHSNHSMPFTILKVIKAVGYAGVDICLFASGIGCYYSLSKDNDSYAFMKRRVCRLVPKYWIFMSVWVVWKALSIGLNWREIIGNFLFVQSITGLGNDFNWYISALLLFYVMAPCLKGIVDKSNKVVSLVLLVFFLLLSIPFWTVTDYILIVTRIPIFYIGMLCGKASMKEKELSFKELFIALIGLLVGIILFAWFYIFFYDKMWSFGLYWYPFIIIVPGLCIIISCVLHFLATRKCLKWIVTGISLMGRNSFSIYLIHILVFDFSGKVLSKLIESEELLVLVEIGSIIVGCIVLNWTSRVIILGYNRTVKILTS